MSTLSSHLTRRDLSLFFFAGYALSVTAAEASPIRTSAEGLKIATVEIPNGEAHALPAYVARPKAAGKHPVVIVVNEIFGIHAYIQDVCKRLAQLGYVAVAPAFFYRSGVDLAQITDFAKIMPIVAQTSDAQVDADVQATLHWLQAQDYVHADKIGMTGFCWGGAVVWRTAMAQNSVKAGVAWYGRLEKFLTRAADVRIPVLGLYGTADKGIPLADVEKMRAELAAAGKTDCAIELYQGAGHGFHADYRESYNPAAATDGWGKMLAHFKAHGVG
jgi:carboxymethylenebutenolidase